MNINNSHRKQIVLLPPINLPDSLTLIFLPLPLPVPALIFSPATIPSIPKSLQTASRLLSIALVIPNAACWSGTTSSSSSGFGGWYCGSTYISSIGRKEGTRVGEDEP